MREMTTISAEHHGARPQRPELGFQQRQMTDRGLEANADRDVQRQQGKEGLGQRENRDGNRHVLSEDPDTHRDLFTEPASASACELYRTV